MRWIKWYAIDWINSTARDEMTPAERGTWTDFVCLARFPGSTPGTFKFASYEALARKLNTPLEVVLSTRDKCLANRIRVEQDEEGFVMTILNWDKYQGLSGTEPRRKESSTPDPRVTTVSKALEAERGYVSLRYAAEAAAISRMLKHYSPGDILGCWRALKEDPIWQKKELLMPSVETQLPAWVKRGRQADDFRGGKDERRKPGAGQLPTDEDFDRERQAYHSANG